MHPTDHKGFIEGADSPPGDHIEDRHFPLVVDHREVPCEVAAGTGGGDDPGAIDPDEAVLFYLAADIVKQGTVVRKNRRTFQYFADFLPFDLPVLDRHCRDLICQHVRCVPVRGNLFDLVGFCLLYNDKGFEQVVKPRGKDRPFRYGVQLVACTSDPLHQPGDLPGRTELDDMIDPPDIDPQFHRRGTDKGPDLAPFEPLFGIDPHFL